MRLLEQIRCSLPRWLRGYNRLFKRFFNNMWLIFYLAVMVTRSKNVLLMPSFLYLQRSVGVFSFSKGSLYNLNYYCSQNESRMRVFASIIINFTFSNEECETSREIWLRKRAIFLGLGSNIILASCNILQYDSTKSQYKFAYWSKFLWEWNPLL